MSAFGMKPNFKDYEGYKEWRQGWRELHRMVTSDIRSTRSTIKRLQRKVQKAASNQRMDEWQKLSEICRREQKEFKHKRVMGWKLMTLLEEAKIRWENIENIRKGIEEQYSQFPLEIEDSRNIVFHFNKKHLEFSFIPMWIVKVKGQSYYVHHVDCETAWTTKESPDHPSTKGAIRIKRGNISISEEGVARIY